MEKLKISVYVDRENLSKTLEFEKTTRVSDLLEKLNINPVTVIVSRNNELVLEDDELENKDEIKILSVISGG